MSSTATEHIPYVTAWSEELAHPTPVIQLAYGSGIAYPNETPDDRDPHGVLWKRAHHARGQGKPVFGTMHSTRQRHAMANLLCQICAAPADQDDDGILWLLQDNRTDWPGWPNQAAVYEPPICAPCAALPPRLCPALRNRAAVIRVRSAPITGIRGGLFAPGPDRTPRALRPVHRPYPDSDLSWTLAYYLLRGLQGATIVESPHRTTAPAAAR
ncbi:hypothetical protein [Actinokineospora pegani]|uniref:hypothetical protein n=1 Tax=Actinokineospora pegani TaxID=2654637 RepID=UPI0012EA057D|nr:hypothetical protein [Actinokineospora pegani]